MAKVMNPTATSTEHIKAPGHLLRDARGYLLRALPAGIFLRNDGAVEDSHGRYAYAITLENFECSKKMGYLLAAKSNMYGYIVSAHEAVIKQALDTGRKILLAIKKSERSKEFRYYVFEPKTIYEEGEANFRGLENGQRIPMLNFNIKLAVNLLKTEIVMSGRPPATDPFFDFLGGVE